MQQQAARLKLDDGALCAMLDELDAQDGVARLERFCLNRRFRYRVPNTQFLVRESRDVMLEFQTLTRSIGQDGVSLIVGGLVHTGRSCEVRLQTVGGTWQTVHGIVRSCRYVQGSPSIHETEIRFDRPIDPASFARSAVRARVLAADDSAMAVKLIRHVLEALNADVTTVSGGVDALSLARDNVYDVVLLDIEMPDMDGWTVVRMLRNKGYLRKIIALSALEEKGIERKCAEAGFDGYVPKSQLRSMLAEVIEANKPTPLVSSMLDDVSMQPLIDEFVKDLPQRVRAFETALTTDSMSDLQIEARKLKGEASGFGFEPLTDATGALERLLTENAPETQIRAQVARVVNLCLAARPATVSFDTVDDVDTLANAVAGEDGAEEPDRAESGRPG
ncbi:MAG: response regulator [Phycisphaerales bacterium]|nr:response regulator [Phycisphaerales bacterium]